MYINHKNLKFNDHRYLPLIAINNGDKNQNIRYSASEKKIRKI